MTTRRDFVATSLAAGMVPVLAQAGSARGQSADPPVTGATQLLELRRIRLRNGPMVARYNEYAKNALVPAMNRAGVKPVGVFNLSFGPDSPAIYILVPHPSVESVVTLTSRLTADAEYVKAGAAFRALPATDPPYVRRDSTLMTAFAGALEVPSGANAVPSRVFEVRTYESHNYTANMKKIQMFEKGCEIPIFRRVGLSHVFFGRNVVGANLPSLTYMLVFPSLAILEKNWAVFRDDPEWVKLRAQPEYADIVSNISNVLLRPADYSQI